MQGSFWSHMLLSHLLCDLEFYFESTSGTTKKYISPKIILATIRLRCTAATECHTPRSRTQQSIALIGLWLANQLAQITVSAASSSTQQNVYCEISKLLKL